MGSQRETDGEDERLLAGVIAGDAAALDRWYRRDHPAVWRLAYGLLGERAKADDLAQDAMLHLHDELRTHDPVRSYRAWRDAVVWNLARDRMRRLAARRRAETGAGEARGDRAAPAASAGLERDDLRALLERALDRLPERERAAFVLRELEQHSTAHVALVLGIGESTVRTLLTLARRRLRELLGEHLDPRPAIGREGADG